MTRAVPVIAHPPISSALDGRTVYGSGLRIIDPKMLGANQEIVGATVTGMVMDGILKFVLEFHAGETGNP